MKEETQLKFSSQLWTVLLEKLVIISRSVSENKYTTLHFVTLTLKLMAIKLSEPVVY